MKILQWFFSRFSHWKMFSKCFKNEARKASPSSWTLENEWFFPWKRCDFWGDQMMWLLGWPGQRRRWNLRPNLWLPRERIIFEHHFRASFSRAAPTTKWFGIENAAISIELWEILYQKWWILYSQMMSFALKMTNYWLTERGVVRVGHFSHHFVTFSTTSPIILSLFPPLSPSVCHFSHHSVTFSITCPIVLSLFPPLLPSFCHFSHHFPHHFVTFPTTFPIILSLSHHFPSILSLFPPLFPSFCNFFHHFPHHFVTFSITFPIILSPFLSRYSADCTDGVLSAPIWADAFCSAPMSPPGRLQVAICVQIDEFALMLMNQFVFKLMNLH